MLVLFLLCACVYIYTEDFNVKLTRLKVTAFLRVCVILSKLNKQNLIFTKPLKLDLHGYYRTSSFKSEIYA